MDSSRLRRPIERIANLWSGQPPAVPAEPAPNTVLEPRDPTQRMPEADPSKDPTRTLIPRDEQSDRRVAPQEVPATIIPRTEQAAGRTVLTDASQDAHGLFPRSEDDTNARQPGAKTDSTVHGLEREARDTGDKKEPESRGRPAYTTSEGDRVIGKTHNPFEADNAPPLPNPPGSPRREAALARLAEKGVIAPPEQEVPAPHAPPAETAETATYVRPAYVHAMEGPKKSVVGDNVAEVETMYDELTMDEVYKLCETPGKSVVIIVDFGQQPKDAGPSGWAAPYYDEQQRYGGPLPWKVHERNVMERGGIVDALTPEQFAESVVSGLGIEDSQTRTAYRTIITNLSRTLGRKVDHPETGTPIFTTAEPVKIRDALRYLCGAHIGPKYPHESPDSLSVEEMDLVEKSLGESRAKALEQHLEPLREKFDEIITHPYPLPPRNLKEGEKVYVPPPEEVYRPVGNVTIHNVSVSGIKDVLRVQRAVAINAVLATVAQNADERLKVVVLKDLEEAEDTDPNAGAELRTAFGKNKNITTITTIGKGNLTEQTVRLIDGGYIAFTDMSGPQAAILSTATRRITRDDESGVSDAVHANLGSSTTYEKEHGAKKLKSANPSGGTSFDHSVSRTVAPGPALREDEINAAVTEGHVGIIGADGLPRDVYSLETGERVSSLPLPKPRTLDTRSAIARIQLGINSGRPVDARQLALGSSAGAHKLPSPATPDTPPEMNKPRSLESPQQERKRLQALAGRRYKDPVTGREEWWDLPKVAHNQWLDELDHGETKLDWESWAKRHGLKKGEMLGAIGDSRLRRAARRAVEAAGGSRDDSSRDSVWS